MATTSMTIRIDENLKKQAEVLFENMGMNMTTAITVFIKAAIRQNKIPFEIAADPFFSAENQARLQIAKERMEQTGGTVHELIEVYDD